MYDAAWESLVSRRASRRNVAALILALVIGSLIGLVQLVNASRIYQDNGLGFLGPLAALESAAQDAALNARSPESYLQIPSGSDQTVVQTDPRSIITLVKIDEKTLAELGAYNGGYPRALQAQVVEQLLTGHPRVIAFDLGFFESTVDDPALASAFDQARKLTPPTRIVLGAAGGTAPGEPPARGADGDLVFARKQLPVALLIQYADVGLTNVVPDARGAVRRVPLIARAGDQRLPTLGLAVLSAYLRRPQPYDSLNSDALTTAGRRIPVDEAHSANINFFGPPGATFREVSFVDVLEGRADPTLWTNGIVLVGVAEATGLADDYWTPVSASGRKMAGLEIHANVIATLFSTQFLRELPVAAQVAPVLGLALIASFAAVDLGVLLAALVAIGALIGYSLANVWAVYALGWQMPLATPLLAGGLGFAASTAYRVGIEQRQARALVRMLAAVVPPDVAQQIARDPDRVRLGGERRVVTVLFADLRGFTTFSEMFEPEVVGRVSSEYLDAMTDVVFGHGGTVDKFVGDQVMALWNAPLDDSQHARHACSAALAMQARLSELSDRWQAQGLPRQAMRIGINTGPASVGNMGGSRRFAYTAVGDAVNLAARLEPLNNEYGTAICISHMSFEGAGGSEHFLARFLDLVIVKGKSTPVAVYELLGDAHDAEHVAKYASVIEEYQRDSGRSVRLMEHK